MALIVPKGTKVIGKYYDKDGNEVVWEHTVKRPISHGEAKRMFFQARSKAKGRNYFWYGYQLPNQVPKCHMFVPTED